MMTRDNRGRDPFAGLRATRPPDRLGTRVLAAARDALPGEAPRSVWDRLWESRPLRTAWAVTTLGLVAAHGVISLAPDTERPRSHTASVVGQDAELRDVLALPRVEISPRAERIALGAPARPDPNPTPADPGDNPTDNEVKS